MQGLQAFIILPSEAIFEIKDFVKQNEYFSFVKMIRFYCRSDFFFTKKMLFGFLTRALNHLR